MRFLSVIICLCSFGASAKPQAAADLKPVKIPFVLMPSGHFLVSVKINDKGPYKLIFDTGAPTMLIGTRIAKESGVSDTKASTAISPFGAFGQMRAKSIEIGPLKAEDVSMMVIDHPTVKAFSNYYQKEHGLIDGIVGFPFFARYKMVVDYQAKELTMTPNGYVPTDVVEALMKMMLGNQSAQGKPKIAAPTGFWGLVVDKEAKDEEAGVTIKEVMANSPAEKAGLQTGDRLLTLGGRWTDSVADTYLAASYAKPLKPINVVIKREGKEIKLKVEPAMGL